MLVAKDVSYISLIAGLVLLVLKYYLTSQKFMRLERAEVDPVLIVCCTMEIIVAKEILLTVFVHLLQLYYLYYFCVHYNACYYTYCPSPA